MRATDDSHMDGQAPCLPNDDPEREADDVCSGSSAIEHLRRYGAFWSIGISIIIIILSSVSAAMAFLSLQSIDKAVVNRSLRMLPRDEQLQEPVPEFPGDVPVMHGEAPELAPGTPSFGQRIKDWGPSAWIWAMMMLFVCLFLAVAALKFCKWLGGRLRFRLCPEPGERDPELTDEDDWTYDGYTPHRSVGRGQGQGYPQNIRMVRINRATNGWPQPTRY